MSMCCTSISLFVWLLDWPERLTVDLLGYDFSDDGSFKSLIDCADELIRLGVNLVVCQKCIHPGMKSHLQSKVIT